MAAQFITVEFLITQYVSQIGGGGLLFHPPRDRQDWPLDDSVGWGVYYVMAVLVIFCTLIMSNLLRSKIGRAWIAIRDNDIAAKHWESTFSV